MNSQTQALSPSTATRRRQPRSAFGVLLGFLAIAGFFLFTEHQAHFFGTLPYLLLLACPLLHFFHHRGHRADLAGHDGPRPSPGEMVIRP